MTIITYEFDSSPQGIRERLQRKNTKLDMATALQRIHYIRTDEKLSDAEKLTKIRDEMFLVL